MNKKKIYKIVAVSLVLITLVVIIWFAFWDDFGSVYKDDISIISPDGKHQLVIREWGTVGGTGAEIYTTNPHLPTFLNRLLKVKIGNTSADDSCYPFSDGNYDVLWEEDFVVIYYFKGRTQTLDDKSTWSFVRCALS